MGNCNCVRRETSEELYPYRVADADATARQHLLGPPPPYEVCCVLNIPASLFPLYYCCMSWKGVLPVIHRSSSPSSAERGGTH